ncbi:hypothetical protein ACTXT7_015912 [Hymenolepis weldensis]
MDNQVNRPIPARSASLPNGCNANDAINSTPLRTHGTVYLRHRFFLAHKPDLTSVVGHSAYWVWADRNRARDFCHRRLARFRRKNLNMEIISIRLEDIFRQVSFQSPKRHRQAQALLKNSVNVNATDKRGFTPLHMAARQGHQLVLCTLLDAGARWNARAHQQGITPLHCATISGFSVCFNRLLDVAKQSWDEAREETVSKGETEPSKTCSLPHTTALKSFRDDLGRSLVHTSALGGSVDCFRTLLLSGSSPFDLDAMGRTPLHYAILSTRITSYLEESPTRISTKSTSVAELIRVLLKLGVDPNHSDVHGCTALHLASAFDVGGSLIRVLLLYGANKNAVLSRSLTEISPNEDNDSCSSASSSVSDLSQPSHATTKSSMIIEAGGDGTHNSRFSSYALSSAASEEQICAQNAVFTPPSLPFQTGAHVKAAYCPLHIAAAMGNRVGVKIFLQGVSTREACLLILDSAKMTRYVPKNAVISVDFDEGIKREKTEISSHFFYSPLFLAAFKGHTDCVKVLMNACKSRSRSKQDEMLTEEEEDDFMSTVDECNEDDDSAGEDQKTRLNVEEAKENGNNSEVDATLRDGDSRLSFFYHPPLSDRRPCGKLTDPLGRTLLHYAAYAGRLETCQLLLTHSLCQADPASLDDVHGWTAVHYAASQGHSSVVGLLLRHSARENPSLDLVNARDKEGRTALMLATENMHTSVIELLCSLSLRPSRPVSVYDHSCDAHIVHRVIIVDRHGRTALHRSAALGHAEAAGASLTLADKTGKQALHFASISGCIEVLDVLLQTVDILVGSHVTGNARILVPLDCRGFTPLHYAVQCGHHACVERLLKVESYKYLLGLIKNSNSRSLQSSMGAVLIDSVNESEMTGHWQIDHHRCKDDLPTGRLLCPVDAYHKNYMERRWLQNPMKSCHPDIRYEKRDNEKKG